MLDMALREEEVIEYGFMFEEQHLLMRTLIIMSGERLMDWKSYPLRTMRKISTSRALKCYKNR